MVVDSVYSCVSIIDNCYFYAEDYNICFYCDTNYYPDVDRTACETCTTDSNQCDTCSANTCTHCKSGYIIDNSECKACPYNCACCDKSDTTKYQTCADGYFITKGYTYSACSLKC